MKPDTTPETRHLLERAKEHLETHLGSGGQFTPFYPRVMMLLGEQADDVESAYVDFADQVKGNDKVRLCQHFGRFLECIGRKQQALEQYRLAINVNNSIDGSTFKPFIAIFGLKRHSEPVPKRQVM